MNTNRQKTLKTEYPHIVKVESFAGEQTVIEGTRIAVWHIVGYYYRVGMTIDEILAEWDYLTPQQVFSALAYYHDHKTEIDQMRAKNSYEHWLENYAYATV